MPTIRINDCFPEAADGTRGPLPKQEEFLAAVLDPLGPKFTRYIGGLGSGKSLIGCITMLSLAIQRSGDYLIGRQFMPELRSTTYKTFLEICPPDLIKDHKVADAVLVLKTADGGLSNIFFRGLDEADKLRSMNLNAFFIDEAQQVTENAFIILQGRLRGKHWRKGFQTQNSAGHDWSYHWYVKQAHIQDVTAKKAFKNIVAPTTENIHLPEGYIQSMMSTWSEDKIQRELLANEDAFEGQVYNEFRQDTHVIQPFKIPDDWTRVVGADHGYRNPTAWVWGAVDPDDNLYIYREFYEKEWLVEEIVNGKKGPGGKRIQAGVKHLMRTEAISAIFIDPSTRAKTGKKSSIFEEYVELLPSKYPLIPANNEKAAGIEKVKQYLKVDKKTGKPRVFIFNTCRNLIDELITYRYAEMAPSRIGKVNDKEEPMKYNDHACDAFRYLIMSRPEKNVNAEDWYREHKHDYNSIEGALHRDFEQTKKNLASDGKDPFGDINN